MQALLRQGLFSYASRKRRHKLTALEADGNKTWQGLAAQLHEEFLTAFPEATLSTNSTNTWRGHTVYWVNPGTFNALQATTRASKISCTEAPRTDLPPESIRGWWLSLDGSGAELGQALILVCEGEPDPSLRGTFFFQEPIDAVITWVDGQDPAWQAKRAIYQPDSSSHTTANTGARFADNDELRACLRGLAMYAPWIRHIYLVTDQQVPSWLDTNAEGLTVIDHTDILDAEHLPTFNSHAIESALHRIPGLSEHYIYFNDDVVLGKPTLPEDFFTPSGAIKVFPSPKGIDHEDPLPVMVAAARNQQLIMDMTGTWVDRRYQHTPHAQTKTLAKELEGLIGEELEQTRSHRFRHPNDVSLASSLLLSYAVATGRGAPSVIHYSYVDVGTPRATRQMAGLLWRGARTVNCFNQVHEVPESSLKKLSKTLNLLWPWASPWENY